MPIINHHPRSPGPISKFSAARLMRCSPSQFPGVSGSNGINLTGGFVTGVAEATWHDGSSFRHRGGGGLGVSQDSSSGASTPHRWSTSASYEVLASMLAMSAGTDAR